MRRAINEGPRSCRSPLRLCTVGQLLSNPSSSRLHPISARSPGRDKEAGKLLDDIASAPSRRPSAAQRRVLPGHHAVHRRDASRASRLTNGAPAGAHLEVVDGFQRLTTLTILLCVLRDLDDDEGQTAQSRGCWRRSAPARARTRGPGCRSGDHEDSSSSPTCGRPAPPASSRTAPACRRRRSASCRCATTSSPRSWATTQRSAASSPRSCSTGAAWCR